MWWRAIGSLVIAFAVWDVATRNWSSNKDQESQTLVDKKADEELAAKNLRLVNVTLPAVPVAEVGAAIEADPTQKQYQIAFTWPKMQQDRNELHHVLHQCFGVRLAKVDDDGIVLALEGGAGDVLEKMSPYVRIYQNDVTAVDSRLISQWQQLGGQIVRFYPRWIDDQIFAAIDALVLTTNTDEVRITGLMHGRDNTLLINQISVNGEQVNSSIRLTPGQVNTNEC